MAGLDPAIYVFTAWIRSDFWRVDARINSGHDENGKWCTVTH
jgi:hypothetical protein